MEMLQQQMVREAEAHGKELYALEAAHKKNLAARDRYGVAMTSRLLTMIGLFCKRAL